MGRASSAPASDAIEHGILPKGGGAAVILVPSAEERGGIMVAHPPARSESEIGVEQAILGLRREVYLENLHRIKPTFCRAMLQLSGTF